MGQGKLPTPDSHVDNEYGTKTMVYNRKKEGKEGRNRKIEREKEVEEIQQYKERKNPKPLIILLGHNR